MFQDNLFKGESEDIKRKVGLSQFLGEASKAFVLGFDKSGFLFQWNYEKQEYTHTECQGMRRRNIPVDNGRSLLLESTNFGEYFKVGIGEFADSTETYLKKMEFKKIPKVEYSSRYELIPVCIGCAQGRRLAFVTLHDSSMRVFDFDAMKETLAITGSRKISFS